MAGVLVPPVEPPGADGGSVGRVPPRLAAVVEAWDAGGRPAQHASTWKPEAWLPKLPEHADILSRLPGELDRPTVRAISAHAAEGPGPALRAFLAVMLWGFGTRPLGPFRTARILAQADDAPQRPLGAAQAVSRSAEAGYAHLTKAGRMRYLGPAFGTKFLLFTQPPAASPTALILDSYVAQGLAGVPQLEHERVPMTRSTRAGGTGQPVTVAGAACGVATRT